MIRVLICPLLKNNWLFFNLFCRGYIGYYDFHHKTLRPKLQDLINSYGPSSSVSIILIQWRTNIIKQWGLKSSVAPINLVCLRILKYFIIIGSENCIGSEIETYISKFPKDISSSEVDPLQRSIYDFFRYA